jgi:hypothetical protein
MSPLDALRRLLAHVRSSGASGWAPEDPADIAAEIEKMIAALESGRRFDRAAVRRLLLPTGSLQEIAMGNGWGDTFVELASVLDAL